MSRLRYGLALACAPWPGVAAAAFHPVEDRPYHLDVTQTRTADGVARRFHVRRVIVFHRVESGFEATVTLEAVDAPAGDIGKMFKASTGALLGVPLRFRLDADGRVTDVGDVDTAIARIAEAIAQAGMGQPGRPVRRAEAQLLAAPLRDAPPERKRAMLASILQPVVRPDGATRTAGRHAISLPSRPPMPVDAALSGTETIVRDAATITVAVAAEGSFTAPAPDAMAPPPPATLPSTTLAITRTVDVASGLLREERELGTVALPTEAGLSRATIETVTRVEPPSL